MAIQLVRRPGVDGVDLADAAASRAWVRGHVRDQVMVKGQPHPKVYLLGDGFMETFDLDAMAKSDPGADLGRTFQLLRRRANLQRCFLVLGAKGVDADGVEHTWAVIFEEVDVADGRRWWMAMLEYDIDPTSGLGRPFGDWQNPPVDIHNPAELPPFLALVAAPPPGSRPAGIRDASDTWQPDIRFAFGDLPDTQQPPVDAKGMVELVTSLGVVSELLTGAVVGTVVVRITGRSWEQWVLGDDMPAPLVEMIRWIANHRLPAAEAVALALVAIKPQDTPPVPGIQMAAEKDGLFVQTWSPMVFPDGPSGRKEVPLTEWWPARAVPQAQRWIGVSSKAVLTDGGEEH